MPDLPLTLACNGNDRTQALHDGTVRPTGIDLTTLALDPEELFWRTLRHREFDVSELSMSSYLMTLEADEPPFVAIPVFPSRFFRHSCIYVNVDAGIDEPADLVGKRMGVPEYQMTASLWVRGMLQDDYGVAPADVHWFHGGQEDAGGREEKLDLSLPADLTLEAIPTGRTLSDLLVAGDLDALVTARTPSAFATDAVERLFPDYRRVERDYYERTGFFPIMHTVVLRRDVYEANPWAAQELTKAFTAAKDRRLERIANTNELPVALPWLVAEVEATRDLMGHDYWPYGVEANRETLEAMTRYSHDQGLTSERLAVGDLFAPNTYDRFAV